MDEPIDDRLGIPQDMAESLRGHVAILIVAIREDGDEDAPIMFASTSNDKTPAWWGILLHDLVQHLANGYTRDGMSPVAAKAEILKYFAVEARSPTGSPILLDDLDG